MDKLKQLLNGPDYIGGMVPGPTIKGQVKFIIFLIAIFMIPVCCFTIGSVIMSDKMDGKAVNTTDKIEVVSEDTTCFDLGWLSVDGAEDMCKRVINGTEYVKPLIEVIAEHNRASSGE